MKWRTRSKLYWEPRKRAVELEAREYSKLRSVAMRTLERLPRY
jgi:hypothetical protein